MMGKTQRVFALLTSSLLLCVFLLYSFAVEAKDVKVFLNDVDITGVSSQSFENVTVRVDMSGNIHIVAPNISVQAKEIEAKPVPVSVPREVSPPTSIPVPARPQPPLTNSPTTLEYYIVAVNQTPGLLGFNINVYINDKFAFTIDQDDTQTVRNITEYFRIGTNNVQYRVVQDAASGRSTNAYLELFVSNPDLTRPSTPLVLQGEEGKLFIYSRDLYKTQVYEKNIVAK